MNCMIYAESKICGKIEFIIKTKASSEDLIQQSYSVHLLPITKSPSIFNNAKMISFKRT